MQNVSLQATDKCRSLCHIRNVTSQDVDEQETREAVCFVQNVTLQATDDCRSLCAGCRIRNVTSQDMDEQEKHVNQFASYKM